MKKLILIFQIVRKKAQEGRKKNPIIIRAIKKKNKNKKMNKALKNKIKNIFLNVIHRSDSLLRNLRIKKRNSIVKSISLMKFMNNNKNKGDLKLQARLIIYLKVV